MATIPDIVEIFVYKNGGVIDCALDVLGDHDDMGVLFAILAAAVQLAHDMGNDREDLVKIIREASIQVLH